jgi:hypothetical protein
MIPSDDIPLSEALEQIPRPVLKRAINDGTLNLHRHRKVFHVNRGDLERLRTVTKQPAQPSKAPKTALTNG